ncbi:MAG: ATPase, partial [Gemmatimonadetes bacterium]|nr:ATPase [Gemmatimonadota bacterium]
MSHLVIGVDGGGTQTRAMVADEAGQVLGASQGDGSAVRPGQAEASADVIATVVREAMAKAGLQDATPRVLCAGVA